MTSLEKILKYIESEESKEISDMKRGKNSLKDEITEAAQIQHSKNDKKKTKTAVSIIFSNKMNFFLIEK